MLCINNTWYSYYYYGDSGIYLISHYVIYASTLEGTKDIQRVLVMQCTLSADCTVSSLFQSALKALQYRPAVNLHRPSKDWRRTMHPACLCFHSLKLPLTETSTPLCHLKKTRERSQTNCTLVRPQLSKEGSAILDISLTLPRYHKHHH